MRTVILVPRRADNGWRDELWGWLRSYLERTYDWPIYEGHDDGPEMFCRSAALNRAALDAGNWDVAVISDADIVAPGTEAAVKVAWNTGAMTLPHIRYCALTEQGTRDIITGKDAPREGLIDWCGDGLGVAQCVVRRDLWDRVGGLDERFIGWGWQDVAFHYACRGLAGEVRLDDSIWHLWHPTDTREPVENREMALAYMAAFEQNRMPEFLEELQCSSR